MGEEKKENILEKYEPGRRRDYAYTAAFRIPYMLQSVILLAVTGTLLALRGFLCVTFSAIE